MIVTYETWWRREAELKQRDVRERRNRRSLSGIIVIVCEHLELLWLKLDPYHTLIKYSVAKRGKWRRHADQIRWSNIPIKQDTDVQFNKPTVKSAIFPFDSSMRDTEPLVTHASSNSFMPYAPNHDNQSAPENYQNILLIMFVINLSMKPNAWWHNYFHGVMRSKFLICMYVQVYIKVLIFAFLSKCMRV